MVKKNVFEDTEANSGNQKGVQCNFFFFEQLKTFEVWSSFDISKSDLGFAEE